MNKKCKCLLEVTDISVYYEKHLALSNVSINVYKNDFLGIIGPNGGGKTTFLKTIAGLKKPNSGAVKYDESCGTKFLGYVPQVSMINKNFPISVFDVVQTGTLNSKISLFQRYSKKDLETANSCLDMVRILKLKDRLISELSGGEFQKMLIARALSVNPKILLLDEPTASVDPISREQIFELLKELNKSMTIILVSHDLLSLSNHVKTLACINKTLTYFGNAEINNNILESFYGLV